MHRGACRLERRFPDRRKAVLENVVVDGSQVPHIKGNRVVRHLLFAEEFFVFADEHRIDFARPHILSPRYFCSDECVLLYAAAVPFLRASIFRVSACSCIATDGRCAVGTNGRPGLPRRNLCRALRRRRFSTAAFCVPCSVRGLSVVRCDPKVAGCRPRGLFPIRDRNRIRGLYSWCTVLFAAVVDDLENQRVSTVFQ